MSEDVVVTSGEKSGYKQLGLKECGKFDESNGARTKLTGWGIICKERAAKGLTRRGKNKKR